MYIAHRIRIYLQAIAALASLTLALVAGAGVPALGQTLRNTTIFIDDSSGNFTILKAGKGGGTFTFPPGYPLSFPDTNGSGTLQSDGLGHLEWGTASFTPAYLNVYNNSISSTAIATGSDVPFTTTAAIQGFTATSTTSFTVASSGIYTVDYTLEPSSASSVFAVTDNSVSEANTKFGGGVAKAPVHCNAVLTLSAGDAISIENETGAAVTLAAPYIGALQASLTIVRIQ